MDRDWKFIRTPFWIFTHVFVGVAIGLFLIASLWQFSRLQDRQDENSATTQALDAGMANLSVLQEPGLPEFTRVTGVLSVVDSDFIRIGGRTYQGSTGTHVVMLANDPDGNLVFLNRGFWPQGTVDPAPIEGEVRVEGYVRDSVDQGSFGVNDVLDVEIAPRFNLEALQKRDTAPDGKYLDYWIQASDIDYESPLSVGVPALLDDPELSEGSHLSYALQWLVFAILTVIVYGVLLRRKAASSSTSSVK